MNSDILISAAKAQIQAELLKDLGKFMPTSEKPEQLELLRSMAVLVTGDYITKQFGGLPNEHVTTFQEAGEKVIQALLTKDVPGWLIPELLEVCAKAADLVKDKLDDIELVDDLFNQALGAVEKLATVLFPQKM